MVGVTFTSAANGVCDEMSASHLAAAPDGAYVAGGEFMTTQQSMSAPTGTTAPSTQWLDITAIIVCTLCWGTTWFAITLQLGVVDLDVIGRFAGALIKVAQSLAGD